MIEHFPVYLTVGNKVFGVYGYIDESLSIIREGKGYINQEDKIVYLYSKIPMREKSNIPYFWKEDDIYYFSILSSSMSKDFSEDRIVTLSPLQIYESSDPNEELYDEEIVQAMNKVSKQYVPKIKPEDDVLKRIIKTAIIEKNVNISRFKSRFAVKHTWTNLRSSLDQKTKMSITNFLKWCELLGLEVEISISDNGDDKISPLNNSIYYKTSTDAIIVERD